MKISSASRAFFVVLLTCLAPPVQAMRPEVGLACLQEGDLLCAIEVLEALGRDEPRQDLLAARVAFQEGRPEEAQRRLERLAMRAPERFAPEGDLVAELAHVRATAEVHAGLTETTRDGISVVHHPGVDRILVDGVVESLTAAKAKIAPLLGGDIPVPPRVEMYPDSNSFTRCSGLPLEAIQTTGVVAISKWQRLLLHSPRALSRGYDWKDTLVHEWIHQLVSWHSRERAPVWLQEGIAKSLDMLWREDQFEIPVHMQSGLAQAIRDDDFVQFEEMRYSFAYLDSAERAALAYAQVSTQMAFLRQRAGGQAIARVLEALELGEDAESAVASVFGVSSFEVFLDKWRTWLETLDLLQDRLSVLPTVLPGEGDEFSQDPVLAQHKDLARKARLGDLMAERGHFEAALVYYEQASPEEDPLGPLLVNRKATVLTELGRNAEASSLLHDSLQSYPEFALNLRLLGNLLRMEGKPRLALGRYRHAVDLDPFDVQVQLAIAELYELLGDEESARYHRHLLRILEYHEPVSGEKE